MLNEDVRQLVRDRAENRCEYCRLRQEHQSFKRFQIEHVIAKQHLHDDSLENLAFACDRCNLHKGTNLSSVDVETSEIVRLFHPRRDVWADHFALVGFEMIGLTPIGRATVRLLQMNAERRLRLRSILHRCDELD